MGIKNVAFGPAGYVRDRMNCFDGTLVMFSLMDIGFVITLVFSSMASLKAFKSLRILRALRVLRITRLLRSLKFMQIIIKVLKSCFANFINIRNYSASIIITSHFHGNF